MMMFELKQTVYYVADEDQKRKIITGIIKRSEETITYLVSDWNGEKECYDYELSDEKVLFYDG